MVDNLRFLYFLKVHDDIADTTKFVAEHGMEAVYG